MPAQLITALSISNTWGECKTTATGKFKLNTRDKVSTLKKISGSCPVAGKNSFLGFSFFLEVS